MKLRYLSLFSGIEAATVAWHPLGWEPVAFAQYDPEHDYSRGNPDFPSAVLAHHYPSVPNLGDVTKITDADIAMLGEIDVVVGGSPCFTAGHLVLCARGLVPIEDVAVGDLVWTHRSRWRSVTATMTRTAPTVRLRGQGHNAMRATPDHPFYAAPTERTWNGHGYTRGVGEPRWVCADSMRGMRWATPIGITRPAGCEPPKALADDRAAYLAGLYVGDGHIGRRPNRACLSVILSVGAAKRERILPALRAAWGTVSDLEHTQSTWRLQLSRTEVAEALLASFGEHSHAKTIPTWVYDMPKAWRHAFMQGVRDTDGGAFRSGWRVTTVSRKLAIGLRLLAAGLGYSTSLDFTERSATHVIQGRTVSQRDTWTVFLRRGNRTSELRTDDHVWGLVRSVEPCEDATVYDITVDEDHSFVCDGLVVHNCQDLSVAGNRAGLAGARSGLFHDQMRIFDAARRLCGARFLLWENVPGAFSSNGGRDFAVVVASMAGHDPDDLAVPPKGWGNEGAVVGPQGMVEWSVLDAQWFGVAQRRKRVFALLDAGDWTRRFPILLEPPRMRGYHEKGIREGENPPARPRSGAAERSGRVAAGADAGGLLGSRVGEVEQPFQVANCLTVRMHKGINTTVDEGQTPIIEPVPSDEVAHAICANEQRTYTNEGTVFQLRNVVAQPVGVTLHGTDGTQTVASYTDTASALRARIPSGVENSTTTAVMHPVEPIAFYANEGSHGSGSNIDLAPTMKVGAKDNRIAVALPPPVEPIAWDTYNQAITGEGAHALRDGHSEGAPALIEPAGPIAFDRAQITHPVNRSKPVPEGPTPTLHVTAEVPAVALSFKPGQSEAAGATFVTEEYAPTLQAQNNGSTAVPAVAYDADAVAPTLTASNDPSRSPRSAEVTRQVAAVYQNAMQVRRLTPRECERLQGFPDDYTLITYRNKPAADGPRYKALGNSMCVNVMRWIGERLEVALIAEG